MTDQVEVAGNRRAGFAPQGTHAGEHVCGVAARREDLAGRRVLGERPLQPLHLVGVPRRHRCRAAHQAQQLGRRQARPLANVGEEIPGWEQGTGGEAHVLGEHVRMVVAAAAQIDDQLRVGEGVRMDRLQLTVRGDGGRFALVVPIAQLLPPDLLGEDLFGAPKALGDFGFRSRQHLSIGETVDVAHLEAVDDQPVVAGEVVGAFLEREWMRVLEVARHRAREMHRVLGPRPWARRFETQVIRGAGPIHGNSPILLPVAMLCSRWSLFDWCPDGTKPVRSNVDPQHDCRCRQAR